MPSLPDLGRQTAIKTVRGKRNFPLLAIVALAVSFRFAYIDLLRYDLDNAFPAAQAIQMLEGEALPLSSIPTSVALPNPPLMSYLQAIPLAVVRSPLAALLWVAALNLALVPIVYYAGRRHFDESTAIVAALLAAASPWTVFFSRLTWVQGVMHTFSALTALLLLRWLDSESPGSHRWLLLAILAASLGAQTFLLAYLLLIPVGVAVLIFHRRISRRTVVLGLAIVALVSLPFSAGLVFGGGVSGQALARLREANWTFDFEALEHALRLVDGFEFAVARTADLSQDLPLRSTAEGWIHLVSVGLFLLGVWGAVSALRQRSVGWEPRLVTLLWFFAPVALMLLHLFPIHPHYLLLSAPAGYLLVGMGATHLLRLQRLKWPFVAAAMVFAAVSGLNLLRYSQVIEAQPDIGRLAWLPLRYSASMGQRINHLADRWGVDEVYSELDEPILVALTGRTLRAYREFDAARFVVIPQGRPALYVLRSEEIASVFAIAERQDPLFLPGQPEATVDFYVFPTQSRAELSQLPARPLDIPFSNGFRLLGYDLVDRPRPGVPLHVTTFWLVEELRDDRFTQYYGPFLHLVDQAGQMLLVGEASGAPGYLWREDDLYVITGTLDLPGDLPDGRYWIRLGLYDPNADRRAQMVDRQGSPGSDFVEIGPLEIDET